MLGDGLTGFDHGANIVAPEVTLNMDEFGSYIIEVSANRSGTHASIATGDGSAWLLPLDGGGKAAGLEASFEGAVAVSQAADVEPDGFLLGLDDGTLRRIRPDGAGETFSIGDDGWVDTLAVAPAAGRIACSVGRTVSVLDGAGERIAGWTDHPSTPAGLCFSPDGRLLAVARYNGVTVWDVESGDQAHDLYWRGSHTAVSWSHDGKYIVTATQDRDLHCWRVADGRDYRMSGYPSKIRGLAWSWDSRYVCASGADAVTAWHCDGDGPAGKPPLELGYVFNSTVTQVACHPSDLTVAAGYDDGTVLIGDITNGEALIAKPAGGGMVTALAWAPDGMTLIAGTEAGSVAMMRLTSPDTAASIN